MRHPDTPTLMIPTKTVVNGLIENAELIYRLAENYYPGDDPRIQYTYDDIRENEDWKTCGELLDDLDTD